MAPLKMGRREVRQTRGVAGLAALLVTACLVVLVAGGQASLSGTLFELDKDASNDVKSILAGTLNAALPASSATTSIQICQVSATSLNGETILIDAERMTLANGANAPGGGCANKRNYAATRAVGGTTAGAHAKAENVTRLDFTAQLGNDWDDVFDLIDNNPGGDAAEACLTLEAIECAFTHDERAASIFTQSKDYDEISGPEPAWSWRDQSVPDADELDDGFAVKYVDGDGHQQLYFGGDRAATNGTKDAGFWFFHDTVTNLPPVGGADGLFEGLHTAPHPGANGAFCVGAPGLPNGTSNPNCSPRDADDSAGDILVLTTFTNGGAAVDVRVFEWIGPAGSVAALRGPVGAFGDCGAGITPSTNGCATVNNTTIESPWDYSGKFEPALNQIASGGFLEGGVDLTALGLEGCFSSFMATSRSSSSLTADPKDFILGNFEVCGAKISITPDDLNEVNDTHTFTVKVSAGVTGQEQGIEGVFPEVTLTNSEGAGFTDVVDGCADDGTDENGECTVSFTSATAGTVTGHASATVEFEGGIFEVETDGQSGNSGDAVKQFVDASIAIAPNGVNEVGDDHVFTVTVTPAAPAGVTVDAITITPSVSPAPDELASSCNLVAAAGPYTCTITISNDEAGTFTANADLDITFKDADGRTVLVERSTSGDNGPVGSGSATKRFVDASITIAPDGVNEVGENHVFTINVTPEAEGTSITAISIAADASPDPDFQQSNCGSVPLAGPYTCTLTISNDEAGTFTADASVSITFSDGTNTDTVVRSTSGNNGPDGSDSAVKDFVDAAIAVSPSAVNEVGEEHTFTITATAFPGGTTPGTPVITYTLTPAGPDSELSNCATPEVLANVATCTVTISDDQAGTFSIHASVSWQFTRGAFSDTVVRETDGLGDNSGDAVKRFVDARISITPDDTNGIGESHTFVVKVEQDDGLATGGDGNAGFGPPAAGTKPVVTLTPSGGAVVDTPYTDTCASPGTDAGGQCSVTFTSQTAGTVVGSATVSLNLGLTDGGTVNRSTDGSGGSSGVATKVFVDGSLSWIKHDQNGQLLAGATFEVCRTHGFDSSTTPDSFPPIAEADQVCVTVLDNSAPDADPDGGEFLLVDLYLGRYSIEETIAPTGYQKSNAIQHVQLDLSNPNGSAAEPFVNVRLYKLIVITCNESLNEFVTSQVDLDGVVKYTFAPGVPHPWVLSGLTEQQICGITQGATFGGLGGGVYTPEVELPDDPGTP